MTVRHGKARHQVSSAQLELEFEERSPTPIAICAVTRSQQEVGAGISGSVVVRVQPNVYASAGLMRRQRELD